MQLSQGFHCCYASVEEAEAARAVPGTIIVDGVPLGAWNGPVEPQCHEGNCGQGFGVNALWVATVGTHAAVPYNIGGPIPCTLIVEP